MNKVLKGLLSIVIFAGTGLIILWPGSLSTTGRFVIGWSYIGLAGLLVLVSLLAGLATLE